MIGVAKLAVAYVNVAVFAAGSAAKQTSDMFATSVLEYHPASITSRIGVVGVEPNPAPAAARTAGTNAEPKSPASKLAVATAVANFFLMN
jgi:hypothetical protein